MHEIKEESILVKGVKRREGVFYSTIIDGEKFVSQIVITNFNDGRILNEKWIEKWKKKAKEQVENTINEIPPIY